MRNDAGATNRVGRKGTEWVLERRDQRKNAKRRVGRCIGGRRGAVGGRPMELRDGSEGRTEIGRSEGHGASGFPFSERRADGRRGSQGRGGATEARGCGGVGYRRKAGAGEDDCASWASGRLW